jgi:RND family efflux transporter MFP subunit
MLERVYFRRLITASAAVCLVTLTGCGDPPVEAVAPPPVLVVTVQQSVDERENVYTGEVRARHEVDLAFRIPGKLVARRVGVGSAVRAGELLAQLDPADVTLNADAAQSQLLAAETDYHYSKSELERFDSLLEKKYISPAIHEGKRALFLTAKARVEQARAQAAAAGNQAAYASLHADRAGLVSLAMAEPGQVVGAGQPILRLADPAEKEVVIAVPENRLAGLKLGARASIRLWAAAGKTYSGQVREIAPTADPLTRTFALRIRMTDADEDVRLGMTANAWLGEAAGAVVKLPLTAVTQTDGQSRVWVLGAAGDGQGAQVQPRAVRVLRFTNDSALIAEGLQPGERVVALGVQKLLPGMLVQPQEITQKLKQAGQP